MSHYLTVVLADPEQSEEEIERQVDRLLLPHSNVDDPEKEGYKCDGWVIGGRFDGQIYGAPPEHHLSPDFFQRRYGFDVVKAGANIRAVSTIPESFLPNLHVIVDPTGKWTCCYDSEFKDAEIPNPRNGGQWETAVRSIFDQWKDQLAMVVDAHY